MKVLIGTTNPAKSSRYATILRDVAGDCAVEPLSLRDVAVDTPVLEDGASAAENACKKARTYARMSGLTALSIDEALEIGGLSSSEQPGPYVRRYGGRERTDQELVHILLTKIKALPSTQRAVTWTYALCLALPAGRDYLEQVTLRGGIADMFSGTAPAGYPLSAIITDLHTGKRVCDLSPDEQRFRLAPVYRAVETLIHHVLQLVAPITDKE